MGRSVRPLLSGIGVALCVLASARTVNAEPIEPSALYFFGDSLMDTGNLFLATGGAIPPPMSYADGRFSNGPLWVETFAQSLGFSSPKPYHGGVDAADPSISFAYGGAGTGLSQVNPGGAPVAGLLGQVQLFDDLVGGTGADPDALYVIWSGGNDYLLAGAPPPTAGYVADPAFVTANIATAVEELRDAGARHFLVLNLPNLGDVPFARMAPPGVSDALNAATAAHNAALQAALDELAATYGDLTLQLFDVQNLVAQVLETPEAFGFSTGLAAGPATGCLFPPFACPDLSGEFGSAGAGLFFWDELHPTAQAHRLIAQRALAALSVAEPGAISGFAFALAALALFGTPLRRRRDHARSG